ncbi:MAG TPA: enoyl-CoA hydratase/isomerase family protein [Acidimicrobiales bacterium]|nr:enoyl-CoA hydratase/isomerase family protein [Acidimicrobiales bacterium]
MIEVEQRGEVQVLHMRDGENRFNRASVDALNDALDVIEGVEGPLALVTTGEGKFYSNGLDLDWLASAGPEGAGFLDDVHGLLRRMLGFPAVTVAAVNGHAFAAGAMFASAHDFVVMRDDRGYWCLPEVDIGLPLTDVMYGLLAAKLPTVTTHEAITTGRRYDAGAARAAGIAHDSAPDAGVLRRAVERATGLAGKNRSVVARHKRLMYAAVLGGP